MFLMLARVVIQRSYIRNICSTKEVTPTRQTIYALSSAQGRAAISVIRISGPQTGTCLAALLLNKKLPKPRYATLAKIWNPTTRVLIDRSLILWFPSPNSYTGEDSAEIHIHGSLAVHFALFDALAAMADVRQATAGEFTRRAFDNDKLDLTEVEGLADLLQAETEAQRKQALSQATGGLVAKYQEWQSLLASQMVRLEADIDFAEVDDFGILIRGVFDIIENVVKDMQQHVADSVCAERVRIGCRTSFIGEPNVGKSSLLNQISNLILFEIPSKFSTELQHSLRNFLQFIQGKLILNSFASSGIPFKHRLAQRNLAIVSPYAGTTRDVLEATLDMGGYPVTLCDTAGLRLGCELSLAKSSLSRNPGFIEKEGMARAREEIKNADLLLIVVDATSALNYVSYTDGSCTVMDYMNLYYEALIKPPEGCSEIETPVDKPRILMFTKIDLIQEDKLYLFTDTGRLCVSSKSGMGIEDLQKIIVEKVERLCDGSRCSSPRLNKERHRQHVNDALRFLRLFHPTSDNTDRAILAGTLNAAIEALEQMTGDSYKESLLDDLFSDFCIGK